MISVIIPTYSRSNYLQRAIDSVLNQTYKNYEIIVVDDNDENSEYRIENEKIMKKYKKEPKVKYIKHKKNLNGSAARNTGIKNSKGDYITFLDDDDYYLSDRLESIMNIINKEKNIDAVYTGVIRISNKKIINIIFPTKEGNLQKELLNMHSFFGTGSNIFIKRRIINEINGFDSNFIRHQDIEFMIRFFENHTIKKIDKYNVIKDETSRINKPNVTKLLDTKRYFIDRFQSVLKKYDDYNNICINIFKPLIRDVTYNSDEYKKIKLELMKYDYNLNILNFLFSKLYMNIKNNIKKIFNIIIIIFVYNKKYKNEIKELKSIIYKYNIN